MTAPDFETQARDLLVKLQRWRNAVNGDHYALSPIAAALRVAYEAGAQDMRERAAKVGDAGEKGWDRAAEAVATDHLVVEYGSRAATCASLARRIRALSLESPK